MKITQGYKANPKVSSLQRRLWSVGMAFVTSSGAELRFWEVYWFWEVDCSLPTSYGELGHKSQSPRACRIQVVSGAWGEKGNVTDTRTHVHLLLTRHFTQVIIWKRRFYYYSGVVKPTGRETMAMEKIVTVVKVEGAHRATWDSSRVHPEAGGVRGRVSKSLHCGFCGKKGVRRGNRLRTG